MKFKITQENIQYIIKVVLFLSVIGIIIQFFPTENKFKYHFEVGKPWSYELVTASFDFPIYKNEDIVEKEKSELLKKYIPYYKLDTTVLVTQFVKLVNEQTAKNGQAPLYQKFIFQKLKEIYQAGIISSEDFNQLREDGKQDINLILPNRVTKITNTVTKTTTTTSTQKVFVSTITY